MSRCFPYPPPGYTLSSARNEALTGSIKLQKERQKKEEKRKEKKERRKERKERRKERKERRKDKKDKTNQNLDKTDIVKGCDGEKICLDPKDEFFQKRREAESEQFEHSSLTEEHGLPGSLPFPSSSYDSTENSNKRKRHSSPMNGCHGHGKAILIRLPSKMQSECHASAKGQRLISGWSDVPAQHKDDTGRKDSLENYCCTSEGTNNIGQSVPLRNNREEICSTSGQTEALAPVKSGIRSVPNAVVNSMQGVELQYKNLLESWLPPRLQDASLYPVDLDWLFQDTRIPDVQAEKRQRSGSDSMSCSRSSALWPRAEYLHEVDAYALPFVVPY